MSPRLLLKLASRERPERMKRTINALYKSAENPNIVATLITVDDDDPSSIEAAQHLSNEYENVTSVCGKSNNKIHAINRDLDDYLEEYPDINTIVVIADDMMPKLRNWDTGIIGRMQMHWPNHDGALWFPDGHVGTKLYTIPIIGVRFYRKFGYIYHSDYVSLWCDNEMMDVYRRMRRLMFENKVPIIHEHPNYGDNLNRGDALLQRTEAHNASDHTTYRRRESRGFDMTEILLSVLIPSLRRERADQRARILAQLNEQIDSTSCPLEVEICMSLDDGRLKIGEKRNQLLERALGRFVAFVDDDDRIADNYIQTILDAILADPELHCIGFIGEFTENGQNKRQFIHSSLESVHGGPVKWGRVNNIDYRWPNHLNPIRRDIAMSVKFKHINWQEDYLWSKELWQSGRIKNEHFVDHVMYYYDYRTDKPKRR